MSGKRARARRDRPPASGGRPALISAAVAVTVLVSAWGYLTSLAIGAGASARGGLSEDWWYLALAGVGATACLFLALALAVRLARRLGLVSDPAAEGRRAPGRRVKDRVRPRIRAGA